jgi:internalin A
MQAIQKITCIVEILIFGVPILPIIAAPRQMIIVKSFEQWCQEKGSLPVGTIKTIDILLKKAMTNDCHMADSKLRDLTGIDLSDNQISDLQPVATLNKLTVLNLSRNRITDLQPLATLNKLTDLGLSGNRIIDIEPLAGLNSLTKLDLISNQISDLKPLAALNQLTVLGLSRNRISDLKPLVNLNSLTALGLSENQIKEKTCPLRKWSICRF